MVTVGLVLMVTVVAAEAVQLLASVTVSEYVPDKIAVVKALKPPLFQA
jgi:hypothetical protein